MTNEKKGLKADFNLITILIIPIAIAINFIVGNLVAYIKTSIIFGQYRYISCGNIGRFMGGMSYRCFKYCN